MMTLHEKQTLISILNSSLAANRELRTTLEEQKNHLINQINELDKTTQKFLEEKIQLEKEIKQEEDANNMGSPFDK